VQVVGQREEPAVVALAPAGERDDLELRRLGLADLDVDRPELVRTRLGMKLGLRVRVGGQGQDRGSVQSRIATQGQRQVRYRG